VKVMDRFNYVTSNESCCDPVPLAPKPHGPDTVTTIDTVLSGVSTEDVGI